MKTNPLLPEGHNIKAGLTIRPAYVKTSAVVKTMAGQVGAARSFRTGTIKPNQA
jgi:hypothetical protein